MIDNNENIIWMSRADASWGGCARGDIIIVRESDLSDAERYAIDNAEMLTTDEICDVLTAAEARVASDTCLCPKDTYKGEGL